jgi:NMD protein affecting ribosome stability and mRNA decay
VARKITPPPEPSMCERCGAVYARRTWRRQDRVTQTMLQQAAWTVCPACEQARAGEYFGRVLLRGRYVAANEAALRKRIDNVADRAEFTQPQRRLVSITRTRDGLEVLTTSQKLAHRIVHEMKKAFRGRATYSWSDRDGSLSATWERDA